MKRLYYNPSQWRTIIDTPCPVLLPCCKCKELLPATSFYVLRTTKGRLDFRGIQRASRCKNCHNEDYKSIDQKKKLLYASRQRATSKGIEWNLTADDFTIPLICPVLGIPLFADVGGGRIGGSNNWNAPTLDRIDNKKGYISGNVFVISRKANTLKGNGTPAELAAVATYAAMALSDDCDITALDKPFIDLQVIWPPPVSNDTSGH